MVYMELFPGITGLLGLSVHRGYGFCFPSPSEGCRDWFECKVLTRLKFLIKFQNTEQGEQILKYSIFPRSWSPVVGVHPAGTMLWASALRIWNIKMIFLLGIHISKSTQGTSSSVLLKPVPVGGRVSCWAHLRHFYKNFESKRRS